MSAVKAYIKGTNKVSETVNFNVYGKDLSFDITVPIQLNLNCDDKYKPGKYELIIDGLDVTVNQKIEIKGKSKKCPKEQQPIILEKDKEYDLIFFTKEVTDTVTSVIKITNSEETKHNYQIWSYIYNGPVSFSGEREQNKVKVSLDVGETKYVTLINNIQNNPKDSINLKIKIQREDRQNPFKFTESLNYVTKKETTSTSEINHTVFQTQAESVEVIGEENKTKKLDKVTGQVVYESSSVKAKKYSVYLLLLVVLLAGIALLKKQSI